MNPFVVIFLIALGGSLVVPFILVGLSAIGLFEPLEFKIFGRVVRTGRHKE